MHWPLAFIIFNAVALFQEYSIIRAPASTLPLSALFVESEFTSATSLLTSGDQEKLGETPIPASELPSVLHATASGLDQAQAQAASIIPQQSITKTRFILIGLLAGVPTLIILSICRLVMRCNKKRAPDIKVIIEDFDEATHPQRNIGARLSSLLGFGNRISDMNYRQNYATSVHNTAGMAGIGAHRLRSHNSEIIAVPAAHNMTAKTKTNFDNPYGTPACLGPEAVTSPSRVTPHMPGTPPLRFIQLPIRTNNYIPQVRRNGFIISNPVPSSRYCAESPNGGGAKEILQVGNRHIMFPQLPTPPAPRYPPGLLFPTTSNNKEDFRTLERFPGLPARDLLSAVPVSVNNNASSIVQETLLSHQKLLQESPSSVAVPNKTPSLVSNITSLLPSCPSPPFSREYREERPDASSLTAPLHAVHPMTQNSGKMLGTDFGVPDRLDLSGTFDADADAARLRVGSLCTPREKLSSTSRILDSDSLVDEEVSDVRRDSATPGSGLPPFRNRNRDQDQDQTVQQFHDAPPESLLLRPPPPLVINNIINNTQARRERARGIAF
ncbi:hypothetical protein BU17DRAFT_65680 [Hysterangium stoloniferum]|nr:hypothetical protein BU17DRAFT_65680 [Hysterangium stoloniferum]